MSVTSRPGWYSSRFPPWPVTGTCGPNRPGTRDTKDLWFVVGGSDPLPFSQISSERWCDTLRSYLSVLLIVRLSDVRTPTYDRECHRTQPWYSSVRVEVRAGSSWASGAHEGPSSSSGLVSASSRGRTRTLTWSVERRLRQRGVSDLTRVSDLQSPGV